MDALDLFDFIDLFVPRETLETVLEDTDAACRDRASKSADQIERRCSSKASPNAEQAGLTFGCLPDFVDTETRLSKLRRRWRGLKGGTSESGVEGLLWPAAAVLGRGGGRGPPNPVAATSSSVCSGDAELRLTSLARHSRAARWAGLVEDFDDDDTVDEGAEGRWACLEYGDEAARTPRNDDLRGDRLESRVALARLAADSGDRDWAGGVLGVSIDSELSITGEGTAILPRFAMCDAERVGCLDGCAGATPVLAVGWAGGAGRGCVDDVEGPSTAAADRFEDCAPLEEPSLDMLPFLLSDRGIMDAATLPCPLDVLPGGGAGPGVDVVRSAKRFRLSFLTMPKRRGCCPAGSSRSGTLMLRECAAVVFRVEALRGRGRGRLSGNLTPRDE